MFPTFKSKDEIPKGFESAYEEKDGQWVAKLPDTSKLETTLATVRGEKKEFEKAARDAAEKAADLQRQLDAKNAAGVDTDKKTADMLAQWNKDKDAAVKAVQDQLAQANAELRTVKLDDQLKAAFLAAGGRPERAAKALHDTKHHFDLVDGQIVKKNEKGDVTTEKASDFYTKTYRAEVPEFYTGTKANGGGAGGGAGPKPATGDPSLAERVLANPLATLREANEAAAA